MKKWGIKPYIAGIVVVCLLQLLYAIRTDTYFSVDDFFVIAYFRDRNVLGIIPDFLINGDINEFRKILGYVVFGGLLKIFGLNHFAFDVTLFITHLTTNLLLFFVVRKITKNDFGAFFVSILFNKNYLFYYSNIHENLVGLFSLLTIFLLLYYPKRFYFAALSFILALFSKETAVTVPFVLLAVSLFYKMDRRKVLYLVFMSIIFTIYIGYFYFTKKIQANNTIYMPSHKLADLLSGYLFFVNYKIIALSVGLSIYFKKYLYLLLLAMFFVTLTPAASLVNRREMYYLYLPFAYLMIYLAMFLPKINLKNSFLYLLVFIIFGGRSVLPKIAWQHFPNWQKESVEKVLDMIENGNSDFNSINLERDAKLMLGSGTTDLFLKERHKYD